MTLFRHVTSREEIYDILKKSKEEELLISGVVCFDEKIYMAVRVLSINHDLENDTIIFELTNGDSRYTRSVGKVELCNISCLQIFKREYEGALS